MKKQLKILLDMSIYYARAAETSCPEPKNADN
jgi:hypothetical protein